VRQREGRDPAENEDAPSGGKTEDTGRERENASTKGGTSDQRNRRTKRDPTRRRNEERKIATEKRKGAEPMKDSRH